MIKQLSILIPVYNQICINKVMKLKELCDDARDIGLEYEILVADDGSQNEAINEANSAINQMAHCKHIIKNKNEGSAATRNFLAEQSKYEWLLFIDCDMDIPDTEFITKYIYASQDNHVVNGGISIGRNISKHNLRYLYEKHEAPAHTPEQRNRHPYQSFRSANFMIKKSIFMTIKFNECMRRYEDVYLGKVLKQYNYKILHIDNPVVMNDFENNNEYMEKIEYDLRTLYEFRNELNGYSRILELCQKIHQISPLCFLVRAWHCLAGKLERSLLTKVYPNTNILKLYRIGYLTSIYK